METLRDISNMLTHVDEGGLGGIVHGLTSRDVNDMSRHASCCDKATIFKVLERSPMHGCSTIDTPSSYTYSTLHHAKALISKYK